jgi:hypothetical protein
VSRMLETCMSGSMRGSGFPRRFLLDCLCVETDKSLLRQLG